MNFRDTVAKVELSDRAETVTSGNYSGKITLHGVYDYANKLYQDCRFYIVTGGEYCTKTGYLDAAKISVDVFNDSGRDIRFSLLFEQSVGGNEYVSVRERVAQTGYEQRELGIQPRTHFLRA